MGSYASVASLPAYLRMILAPPGWSWPWQPAQQVRREDVDKERVRCVLGESLSRHRLCS